MKIEKFDYNSFDELLSNTYVLSDSDNQAVIVDPAKNYDGIVKYLNKNNLHPVAILLTHGHFDHFGGVEVLFNTFPGLDVYIEEHDYELLFDRRKNCSYMTMQDVHLNIECRFVKDKDVLHLLKDDDIEVIYTPFHTTGSVCYYLKNNKWLLSGDTLFAGGIGRYDLPTSCPRLMNSSLGKLKNLPSDVKIYPGHGPNSTIGVEFSGIY